MREPAKARPETHGDVRAVDLPAMRLLMLELEGLLADMPNGPERSRLARAVNRLNVAIQLG